MPQWLPYWSYDLTSVGLNPLMARYFFPHLSYGQHLWNRNISTPYFMNFICASWKLQSASNSSKKPKECDWRWTPCKDYMQSGIYTKETDDRLLIILDQILHLNHDSVHSKLHWFVPYVIYYIRSISHYYSCAILAIAPCKPHKKTDDLSLWSLETCPDHMKINRFKKNGRHALTPLNLTWMMNIIQITPKI